METNLTEIGRAKGTMGNEASSNIVEQEQGSSADFIPGIFNSITMTHIVSRLSWTDVLKLASVSRTWRHGIRSHQVQAERACNGSGQTYIVLPYIRKESAILHWSDTSIALYSMEEDRCYELPRLPPCHAAVLSKFHYCKSVALDGKVYMIEFYSSCPNLSEASHLSRMMAFDVAGQGGWQPCASLELPLGFVECVIVRGKIYAVSIPSIRTSYSTRDPSHSTSTVTSKVYNPQDNTWSSVKSGIKSMQQLTISDIVSTMLHLTGSDIVRSHGHNLLVCRSNDDNLQHYELDVYEPTNDDWEAMHLSLLAADRWRFNSPDMKFEMFTSKGKCYIMDARKIYICDHESGLWTDLHVSNFTEIRMGPVDSLLLIPLRVLVVEEELVALVWAKNPLSRKCHPRIVLWSRSRLGGENREIVWQRGSTDVLGRLRIGIRGVLCI